MKTITIKNLLLTALLVIFPSYVSMADSFVEQNMVISNSLSNSMVRSFAEDQMGRMWIATTRGLDRYDIHSFYNYFNTSDVSSIPDNEIYTVFCDSKDRIWISTPAGIAVRNDQDDFHRIPQDDLSSVSLSMVETNDGKMVFSSAMGLLVYNPDTDHLDTVDSWDTSEYYILFSDLRNNVWLQKGSNLVCYESDDFAVKDSVNLGMNPTTGRQMKNGDIWFASTGNEGITVFSPSTGSIRNHFLSKEMSERIGSATISSIREYSSGDVLFLDSDSRLYFYEATSGNLLSQEQDGFPFQAPDKKIQCIYIDSHQNVWIGFAYAGFEVKYNSGGQFATNQFLSSYFKDRSVISLANDDKGDLYCAVNSDGIFRYSPNAHTITKLTVPGDNSLQKEISNAFSIYIDRDGDLWVGTLGEYVLLCFKIDGNNLKLKARYSLHRALNYVYDSNGKLWISGYNHYVLRIDKSDMSFTKVDMFREGKLTIVSALAFKDGKIICGAYPYGIKTIDPVSLEIKDLVSPDAFSKAITRGTYIPTCFYVDGNDDLWIGTNSNGLFKYHTGSDELEPLEGLPCSDVGIVMEDDFGSMWIGTQDGLVRRNLKTGLLTTYFKEDGTGGNQFNDRCYAMMSDKTVVFGGQHGLTIANPSVAYRVRTVPLVFEDLKVNNAVVRPGEGQPIDKHLSLLPDIKLHHGEDNFSISFSSLDYNQDLSVDYQYMLKGYDSDWIDSGTINVATYSNVPAGRYTFMVKAISKNGAEENTNSIKVHVYPSFWGTWWMKLFYILVACALIYVIYSFRRRINEEKEASRLAELEKEQEKRMNKMNMSFFANVAHEFRTPLTMIAGPVGVLCNSARIVGREKDMLNIVRKSVNRMLQLVNQFMDFNKLENDTLKLGVRNEDIVKDIKSCMEIFSVNAEQKNISLNVHCLEDNFVMWYDSDKLMKVISNLMSNAFKFTPSGGSVTLSFDVESSEEANAQFPKQSPLPYKRYAKIAVTDTGIGIPEDKYDAVFQRYTQLDNQSKATQNVGTGIGLYYAKALVELHHGFIKAGSRSAGSGAVFTFIIPVDDEAYSESERIVDQSDQTRVYPISSNVIEEHTDYDLGDDAQTILVVDDDIDVANYLEVLLSNRYRVIKCYDGESALNSARESSPDIVISDVVMPGMTGYQLCETIKSDIQLSHIPVILVTAKVTVESQVEGLDKGADAYVTKPFDPAYLSALIESMLKNRNKMREHIAASTQTDENISSSLSLQDNALLKDLYSIMESELANPEIDVEKMSKKLKISRTKLYYKIKGLTGETPSDFFRQYKLNRAAQLLKEGHNTITEIADMTGFANQSYFSTVFKKQFGVPPSEYKG